MLNGNNKMVLSTKQFCDAKTELLNTISAKLVNSC